MEPPQSSGRRRFTARSANQAGEFPTAEQSNHVPKHPLQLLAPPLKPPVPSTASTARQKIDLGQSEPMN